MFLWIYIWYAIQFCQGFTFVPVCHVTINILRMKGWCVLDVNVMVFLLTYVQDIILGSMPWDIFWWCDRLPWSHMFVECVICLEIFRSLLFYHYYIGLEKRVNCVFLAVLNLEDKFQEFKISQIWLLRLALVIKSICGVASILATRVTLE